MACWCKTCRRRRRSRRRMRRRRKPKCNNVAALTSLHFSNKTFSIYHQKQMGKQIVNFQMEYNVSLCLQLPLMRCISFNKQVFTSKQNVLLTHWVLFRACRSLVGRNQLNELLCSKISLARRMTSGALIYLELPQLTQYTIFGLHLS